MKFSKKSRYGLTALIDLSVLSKDEQHVPLSNIAERNHISPQYLEQVFAALRRAGIVKSVKGPQGGYHLGMSPAKITVANILEALDGNYHLENEVTDADNCGSIQITIQEKVINTVNSCLDEILKDLTLADLVKEYQDNNRYNQNMYYI